MARNGGGAVCRGRAWLCARTFDREAFLCCANRRHARHLRARTHHQRGRPNPDRRSLSVGSRADRWIARHRDHAFLLVAPRDCHHNGVGHGGELCPALPHHVWSADPGIAGESVARPRLGDFHQRDLWCDLRVRRRLGRPCRRADRAGILAVRRPRHSLSDPGVCRGHGRRCRFVCRTGRRRRCDRDAERSVAVGDLSRRRRRTGVCSCHHLHQVPAARSHVRKRGLVPMSKQNSNWSRRRFLGNFAFASTAIATGVGSWVVRPDWANAAESPIKVGIATDLTGPIGYAGNADANVAKMVVKEINDAGGLLGRPLELFIEDTASNESVAVGNVRKLIQRDKVDLVLGGITSSMRNAIKDVIVARGKTLYIYPQLYEGKECTPYLFCTGPTPAQQCDEFIPWLIKNGGKKFALPSANYVWPHTLNVYARKVIEASGGEVVFEEYYPLDQVDFSATVNRVISNKVDVVFNTVIPPGVGPFFKQLYEAGFLKNGGRLACVYYDENTLNINQANEIEGLASCLDYFKVLTKNDPVSAKIQAAYDKDFPGTFLFAAGSAATGTYRGLKLWEAAVKEAGKVDRDSVAAALDHAKIAEGPGGPAEMVPGQRHCKMKMYTAVAKGGNYDIVARSAGLVDPKECLWIGF